MWVADALGADSARVRVTSCSGAAERKRGNHEEREDKWGKKSLKGDVSPESERASEGKREG